MDKKQDHSSLSASGEEHRQDLAYVYVFVGAPDGQERIQG